MANSVLSVNKSAAEVSLLGSPESPAAETLKPVELLCYVQLFPKMPWWCIVKQWGAASVSSYRQLRCSNPLPDQEKKKGKNLRKLKGKHFVTRSVGCVFHSVKAETGKGSAFGPIYPSLGLCGVGLNCSVSHGDRSELCWRLKSAYVVFTRMAMCCFVPSPFFFKLLGVE